MTRGILSATKQWENDLSAQYLPLEIKDKEGKIQKHLAQLQVRPINFYEIVFPEGSEKEVMGMIKPTSAEGFGGKFGKIGLKLAKLLGLKPPIKDYKNYVIPPGNGVSVLALGTKKDQVNWEPADGDILKKGMMPQEML